SAEHALFKGDVVIYRHVVLNLAVVPNHNLVADEYVLPERYAFADTRAGAYMYEMPDARAFTYLCTLIHDCAGVLVIISHATPSSAGGGDFPGFSLLQPCASHPRSRWQRGCLPRHIPAQPECAGSFECGGR